MVKKNSKEKFPEHFQSIIKLSRTPKSAVQKILKTFPANTVSGSKSVKYYRSNILETVINMDVNFLSLKRGQQNLHKKNSKIQEQFKNSLNKVAFFKNISKPNKFKNNSRNSRNSETSFRPVNSLINYSRYYLRGKIQLSLTKQAEISNTMNNSKIVITYMNNMKIASNEVILVDIDSNYDNFKTYQTCKKTHLRPSVM